MYICDIVTCTCIYYTHVHVLMTKITVFFHIHNYLPSSSCLFTSIFIIVFSPLRACIFLKTKASPSGEVGGASPGKGRPDAQAERLYSGWMCVCRHKFLDANDADCADFQLFIRVIRGIRVEKIPHPRPHFQKTKASLRGRLEELSRGMSAWPSIFIISLIILHIPRQALSLHQF